MRRRYPKVPSEVRRQVIRLAAGGASYRQMIEQLDVSVGTVTNILKPLGGIYRSPGPDSPHRLSLDDRTEIRIGLEFGHTFRTIGAAVGRHASTVCREVNANRGPRRVSAHGRPRGRARACPSPQDTQAGDQLEVA